PRNSPVQRGLYRVPRPMRSEEHTSELQSQSKNVCRLLLEKKKKNTNLSKQQQVSEIMRQMLTQAQTAGQYFTNDQIKEMTRKVSAEVALVFFQTQNQPSGSSLFPYTTLFRPPRNSPVQRGLYRVPRPM